MKRAEIYHRQVNGAKGAYEAVGIESPGLSAAPAIGEMLRGLIRKRRPPKESKLCSAHQAPQAL